MNIKNTIRLSIASLILFLMSAAAIAVPTGFTEEVVLGGRDQPIFLANLPDGRMLLLHKQGLITIFDPAVQPAVVQNYLQITDIESGGERGLSSLALDPDFANNGYVYVYYTQASSSRNRISRFTHLGNTADLTSETLIWQDNENWMSCCHFGGGLGFGPDGKLYLTTGEEFDGAQSPNLARAGGKIIRINKDGSIPADNPFVDGAGGNLDEVWAFGLRNPFRAYWDLPTGRFFIGDVGGNVQATAREEINIGVAGADYGWPNCEGQCAGFPNVEKPLFDYSHTAATPAGGSVSVGFVYRGSQYPGEFNERFFYGDYARSFIRMLTFNPDGSVLSDEEFHTGLSSTGFGAPVHLMQGSDGAMYAVNFGTGAPDGEVLRYTYADPNGNQAPVIESLTATPNQGGAPLTVNFAVSATDTDMLNYRWVFGDGSAESTEQNPSHIYTATGPYFAFVEVSDGNRSVFSQFLLIQVGNVPVVSILTPTDGDLFRGGDIIMFSGAASDPDETIPGANYSWDIRFLHNAHTHPTVTNFTGTNGTLPIGTTGHDWHDNTGFEITLTVTDSDGLSASDSISIFPDKVDVTLDTVPTGIPVFVDGISQPTLNVYDTLIGFEHELSAPVSYCLNGENFVFDSWSNGEAATQIYTVPDTNQALTATYIGFGACLPLPQMGLVLRFEADAGVSTVGATNEVSSWSDQSGQGNNLTAAGNPQLIPSALNGQAVIAFDGAGDLLERVTTLNGLPTGNSDRTIYSVVNYVSTGYGGVAYGTAALNQTFGLIVDPLGNLMVQGWGVANDFDSGIAGSGMGWMTQSAVHQGGQLSHYQQLLGQDRMDIGTRAHVYDTMLSNLVLGAEIDGSPSMDMQIAAVLIYDRALNAAEQDEVESYLQVKYFDGVNLSITVPIDGQTVSSGDVQVGYGAAGTAFDHMHLTLDGGAAVEITNATGSFTFNNVGEGAHSVSAVLVDAAHQPVGTPNSQDMVNFAAADCAPDNFAPNCTVDTDGDGTPDSVEGELTDTDGDGTVDYLESSVDDADGDGTPNQTDANDADPCVPSMSGTGCPQPPPPPPPPSSGGGSVNIAVLLALSGVLAIRRRRRIY